MRWRRRAPPVGHAAACRTVGARRRQRIGSRSLRCGCRALGRSAAVKPDAAPMASAAGLLAPRATPPAAGG
jgi:hypothetical protein